MADYTADTNFTALPPTGAGISNIIRVGRKLLGTNYTNIPAGNAYFTSFDITPTAATSKIRIYYIGAGESDFDFNVGSVNFNSETNGFPNTTYDYREARFGVVCKYTYTSQFGYPQVPTNSNIGMNEYGIHTPSGFAGTTPTTFANLPAYNAYPQSYNYEANDFFAGVQAGSGSYPNTYTSDFVAVPNANYKRMTAWKYYDLDFSEFVGLNATVTITLFAHSNKAQNSQKSAYAYYAFKCLGGGTPAPVADNFTIANQDLGITCNLLNTCARLQFITQSNSVPIQPNRIPLPKTWVNYILNGGKELPWLSVPDAYGFNNFPACARIIATPEPIIQPNHFASIRFELKNSSGNWEVHKDLNYVVSSSGGIDAYVDRSKATSVVSGVSNFEFRATLNTLFQSFTPKYFTVSTRFIDPITPSFSFVTSFCSGTIAPVLPTTSTNTTAITGSWSPATVSNTATGNYTFTPTAGLCATTTMVTVTVLPVVGVIPTFSFATTLCSGSTAPILPTTSDNGITGTWSPAIVSNTATGSYSFTQRGIPPVGRCRPTTTVTVTVLQAVGVIPTFSFVTTLCSGGTAPTLPTTSDNGIRGIWSPAIVSNTATANYIFYQSGAPMPGRCRPTTTVTVTITPATIPSFLFATSICTGAIAPVLPTTSTNSITGTWSPATVSNTATANYTFTPRGGQCLSTVIKTIMVGGCNIKMASKLRSFPFCYNALTAQTTTRNIFDLDSGSGSGYAATIGGVPCTARNVYITNVTPPFPAGLSITPDGITTIAPGTLPLNGSGHNWTRFTFDVCPVASPGANCVNIIYDALIYGGVRADYDRAIYLQSNSFCSDSDTNVLANDGIEDCTTALGIYNTNYAPVTLGTGLNQCTLTEIGTNPYFNIDIDNGNIRSTARPLLETIQTLTYKICYNGIPGNCIIRTARIKYSANCLNPDFKMINNTNKKSYIPLLEKEIIIYPNPSKGLFNIDFNNELSKETKIEVYNMIGQRIVEKTANNGNHLPIDLSDFSNGAYLIKITDSQQIITKTLIKQ